METHQLTLARLILNDKRRLKILKAVRSESKSSRPLFVAAGFVRNAVWDWLNDYDESTKLNDVDVIYFDGTESTDLAANAIEHLLSDAEPAYAWQVKNQAKMHNRNGDRPYSNIVDAMSFWPEKETAVAVRLTDTDELEVISAFGLDTLFQGQITYNPQRSKEIFLSRVANKGWCETWPKLKVVL